MKTIADRQKKEQEAAVEARKQAESDMLLVAKHFGSEDGKKVLELLMRRARVLAPRFPGTTPDALSAASHDGEAKTVLFIVECLKFSGVKEITFPL